MLKRRVKKTTDRTKPEIKRKSNIPAEVCVYGSFEGTTSDTIWS